MVQVNVDMDKCNGCGGCVDVCPSGVYEMGDGKTKVVAADECIECLACQDQCPEGAIEIVGD